jgi:hypothetical protein
MILYNSSADRSILYAELTTKLPTWDLDDRRSGSENRGNGPFIDVRKGHATYATVFSFIGFAQLKGPFKLVY